MIEEKNAPLLLLTAKDKYVFLSCKKGRFCRLETKQLKCDMLLCARYGALFLISNRGNLVPVSRKSLDLTSLLVTGGDLVTNSDNRNLHDNATAQSLSQETVTAMKQNGKHGTTIIKALTASSDTWDAKTRFSRAKWMRRKAKKYIPWVQVLERTALFVTEAHCASAINGSQTCQPHVLACLLARANVKAGNNVIVCDAFRGLIAGAVAERTGSTGKLLLVHDDAPSGSLRALGKASLSHLLDISSTVHAKIMSMHQASCSRIRHSWLEQPAHSLVLACKLEAIGLLKALLPSLHSGCPLVMYSEYVEAMARAYAWLKNSALVVNLKLVDLCQRDFQILESRSHPNMRIINNKAYILSAIKVRPGS